VSVTGLLEGFARKRAELLAWLDSVVEEPVDGEPTPEEIVAATDDAAEEPWSNISRSALGDAAQLWWENRIAEARRDVNAFMSLCFRNDQDPLAPPFEQQWFHEQWQEIWLKHRMSVIHGATGFGKTDQLIGNMLWRIGHNPKIRIAMVCKTWDKAVKRVFKIRQQIEKNALLREVFPDLRPGPVWSSKGLRVDGAGLDATTNTVTPFGVDGDIVGDRCDLIIFDDVTDDENSNTEESRQKIITYADTVVQSRLTTNGQFHIVANAWHPKDLPHVYGRRPGITYRVYPARWRDKVTHQWAYLWESFRGPAWYERVTRTMTPTAAARMFLCMARDERTRIFQKEWFEKARAKGAGLKPMWSVKAYEGDGQRSLSDIVSGKAFLARHRMRVVIGIDLATGKKEKKRKSDLISFFVVGVWPDGGRQLLWIKKGRWPAVEVFDMMRDFQKRYTPERFIVEDNGGQDFFNQFSQYLQDGSMRIEGFTTSSQKWDESLGIEGIGVELFNGRWAHPSPALGETEEAYLARLGPDREPGEGDLEYAARLAIMNQEFREVYANIKEYEEHLLDFNRTTHTPDDVMSGYMCLEGIKRMSLGLFQDLFLRGEKLPPGSPRADDAKAAKASGNAGNASSLAQRPLVVQPATVLR
jgi:hypothetical protein